MCERFGPFIKEARFFFHVCTPWSAFLLHLFFPTSVSSQFISGSSVAKKPYYTDELLLFEDRKVASLPPSSQHTHTHTFTPCYCKRLLVGQLKTSCLWIMTPGGHILCVRHVGFHDWRTCECSGWRCGCDSHLRRLRARVN